MSQAEFDSASQQISKIYARIVDSQRVNEQQILDQSENWDQSGMQRNRSVMICLIHMYDHTAYRICES